MIDIGDNLMVTLICLIGTIGAVAVIIAVARQPRAGQPEPERDDDGNRIWPSGT